MFVFTSCLILSGCDRLKQLKTTATGIFTREEESNNAVDVVDEFFSAMIEKNYSKAYGYIYNDKNQTLEDFRKEMDSVTDIVSVEINWVEVKNNIAVVGIDLIDTYDGEEKIYKDLKVSLVKDTDQKWKINFWD
ncbi:MAG: hypothetical protein FJW61_09825 [Actinobacteria bacterium]|nr:hypothetical protein [Actinomycetota bacterium]